MEFIFTNWHKSETDAEIMQYEPSLRVAVLSYFFRDSKQLCLGSNI